MYTCLKLKGRQRGVLLIHHTIADTVSKVVPNRSLRTMWLVSGSVKGWALRATCHRMRAHADATLAQCRPVAAGRLVPWVRHSPCRSADSDIRAHVTDCMQRIYHDLLVANAFSYPVDGRSSHLGVVAGAAITAATLRMQLVCFSARWYLAWFHVFLV
jgi:hypothetical protein